MEYPLFSTSSRPALGTTQPPIQWVPGALSPGVKRPAAEADHSPQTSAKVKKTWIYTSTPPYVFIAQCLVKHRDNFTPFLQYFLCSVAHRSGKCRNCLKMYHDNEHKGVLLLCAVGNVFVALKTFSDGNSLKYCTYCTCIYLVFSFCHKKQNLFVTNPRASVCFGSVWRGW
jgi:hypothetical protein